MLCAHNTCTYICDIIIHIYILCYASKCTYIYTYISVVIVETEIEIEKHTKCKHDIFDPVSSSKVTRTY